MTPSPTTTTSNDKKKTVFLIRHAESEENRRMASLGTVLSDVRRFTAPKSADVWASFHLLNVTAQVDSSVSVVGKAQIENVAQQLQSDNFLVRNNVTLVVHSPLQRAQETCYGMLQCRAPDIIESSSSTSTSPVQRVVALDELREKTPTEWLPGQGASLRRRIAAWESWLAAQPDTVVAVVGHSQYFKNMLHLSYKFGNCDVYKVEFDVEARASSHTETPTSTTTNGKNDTTSTTTSSTTTTTTTTTAGTTKDVLPPQWSNLECLYQCTVKATDVLSTHTTVSDTSALDGTGTH